MGDMADWAFDQVLMQECYRQDYRLGLLDEEDAYDLGILDECGTEISDPYYNKKYSKGKGLCPLCDSKTEIKEGKFGKFNGCINFPECKGSRSY